MRRVKVHFERAISTRLAEGGEQVTSVHGDLDEASGILWAGHEVTRRKPGKDGASVEVQEWEALGWGVHLASRTVVHDMELVAARVAKREADAREREAARVADEARAARKREEKAKAEAAAKEAEAARLKGGRAA